MSASAPSRIAREPLLAMSLAMLVLVGATLLVPGRPSISGSGAGAVATVAVVDATLSGGR